MKRKIVLDITMGIIMFCLMNLAFTGIQWHEILGIVVFFLFIIHKILNFKWIKSITLNIFKKEVKTKTKVMYVVDVILLVLMLLNVVTGILISRHILTSITASDMRMVSHWHRIFAYWLVIVLFIHIGLHWEFIRNAMKIKKDSLVEKIALGMMIVIAILILLKGDIVRKLMIPIKETGMHYEIDGIEKPIKNRPPKDDKRENNKREGDERENNKGEGDKDTQDNSLIETEQSTIEEYLSKLFCTGCGRHCPLTNPACGKGMSEQTRKIQEYNQEYTSAG